MESATGLVNIEVGKPYEGKIYALHCLKTNDQPVFFTTPDNPSDPVIVPAGGFVQGAIYPIRLVKMIKLGGAAFMGYQRTEKK